jgi:transcriptional regulator with XRE-family HTH domain
MPHFIRAWRKHRDLTQEELAQRMGIGRSYLSKIETGERRYDQTILEAASAILDCTPAALIGRDPVAVDDIAVLWSNLTGAQRTQATAVLKALFNEA